MCSMCQGIGNITIYKSKFILDKNTGYDTLFNISNGSNINILESQFETEAATHFRVSSTQHQIFIRGSIFKKGNITLFSEQPNFMKDAKSAEIIELYSVGVKLNQLEKSTEDGHSGKGNKSSGEIPLGNHSHLLLTNATVQNSVNHILIRDTVAALFSVVVIFTVCGGLCIFCKRKKTKPVKRMREYDAFLCSSDDEWAMARVTIMVLEEQYQLKLFYNDRDYIPGLPMSKNLENAVESSNCAIIILSMGFFESNRRQQDLQRCLMEHKNDPSFQVFIIFTEKKRQLKTHLQKSFLQSSGNREYIRFIFSKDRCLDFNDPKLYVKLFKKIETKRSKTRKIRQRSDEEPLLKDEIANEFDDTSSDEHRSSPDSRSVLAGSTGELIYQRPKAFYEDTDIDVRSFCDRQSISSHECLISDNDDDLEDNNSNESHTSENDQTNRQGNR